MVPYTSHNHAENGIFHLPQDPQDNPTKRFRRRKIDFLYRRRLNVSFFFFFFKGRNPIIHSNTSPKKQHHGPKPQSQPPSPFPQEIGPFHLFRPSLLSPLRPSHPERPISSHLPQKPSALTDTRTPHTGKHTKIGADREWDIQGMQGWRVCQGSRVFQSPVLLNAVKDAGRVWIRHSGGWCVNYGVRTISSRKGGCGGFVSYSVVWCGVGQCLGGFKVAKDGFWGR